MTAETPMPHNLSDWFDDLFHAVRDSVDRQAYREIADKDLSRREAKGQRDRLRGDAGRRLLTAMFTDDAEMFEQLREYLARTILLGQNKLHMSRSEVEPILRGHFSGGVPNEDVRHLPDSSEQGDEDAPRREYDGEHRWGYVPPDEIVSAVLRLLDDPVQWGAPMFARDIGSPTGLVVTHFYHRTLDWLERNTPGEPEPNSGDGIDLGGEGESVAGALLERVDALTSSDYTNALLLDMLLELKQFDLPESAGSVHMQLPGLYDRLMEDFRRFVAEEKSRTGLHKRAAFVMRKLFPAHAWPVSDDRAEEVAPVYGWLGTDTGALEQIWEEADEVDWSRLLEAVRTSMRQGQRHWPESLAELEGAKLEGVDELARVCTHADAHPSATGVLLFVRAFPPEAALRALVGDDVDSQDALTRALNAQGRSIGRLDGDAWEMISGSVVADLRQWDEQLQEETV